MSLRYSFLKRTYNPDSQDSLNPDRCQEIGHSATVHFPKLSYDWDKRCPNIRLWQSRRRHTSLDFCLRQFRSVKQNQTWMVDTDSRSSFIQQLMRDFLMLLHIPYESWCSSMETSVITCCTVPVVAHLIKEVLRELGLILSHRAVARNWNWLTLFLTNIIL